MAKVRAYKIAEELGLDSEEFLKRAREVGFQLKSQTTGLEEDEARELRRKLGLPVAGEQRVEKRVGSGVIRRRKKVEPPPAPVADAPAEPVAVPPESPQPAAPDLPTAEPLVAETAEAAEIRETLSQGLTPMKTTPARPIELPEPEPAPICGISQ